MSKKIVLREFKDKSRHVMELLLCTCGSLLKRRKKNKYKTIFCKSCKEKSTYDVLVPLKSIYNRYQASAWVRELSFDLSLNSFIELVLSNCVYCGAGLSNKFKHRKGVLEYNGVDRVNNNLGYREGNCASCCKTCNTAKLTKTVDEFISWAQKVVNNGKKLR